MNLLQVASMTEDQAREYFETLRWPNGLVCPHCGSENCTRLNGKKHRAGTIQCNACREQFTVKVKSVLESSKKGFSAKQLQRELGLGSYRTAWFMLHRVRHAMDHGMEAPMTGVVEMDETYVGARRPRQGSEKTGRGTKKLPVVALVQRDGTAAHARPVADVTAASLRRAALNVASGDATLMTDSFASYNGMGLYFSGGHHTINHSSGRYVRHKKDAPPIHTQTVECFFSLVKRGHFGVYHLWSEQHLERYCNEFAFRWKHRHTTDEARREAALRQIGGKRLKYEMPA
jgi:transposase-like protein